MKNKIKSEISLGFFVFNKLKKYIKKLIYTKK